MKKIISVISILILSMGLVSCSMLSSLAKKVKNPDKTSVSSVDSEDEDEDESEKAKVYLNDFFVYELSGVDGDGYIKTSVDFDSMFAKYPECFENIDKDELISYISGSWDKEGSLSNGDKITFEWFLNKKIDNIEDKYDIKFKCDDIVITVDGLKALAEINLFDLMSADVFGYDGSGEIVIPNAKTDFGEIIFDAKKVSELSNGEEIVITVSMADGSDINAALMAGGYKPISLEYKLTVEGLKDKPVELADYFEIKGNMPVIKNINADVAKKINGEISKTVKYSNSMESDSLITFVYVFRNTDSVFSVLIVKEEDYGGFFVYAHTIDGKSGLELSNSDKLALAGVPKDQFRNKAISAIKNVFNHMDPNSNVKVFINGKLNPNSFLGRAVQNEYSKKEYNEMFSKKTLNPDKITMFLNSDCKVTVASELFVAAGGGSYVHIYDLDGNNYSTWTHDTDLTTAADMVYKSTTNVHTKKYNTKLIKPKNSGAETGTGTTVKEIKCKAIGASGYYTQSDGKEFVPELTIDGDKKTAWNNRTNNGVGESITYTLSEGAHIKEFYIVPGYTKSKKIFDANYAPTKVVISTNTQSQEIDLSSVAYDFDKAYKGFRIELDEWMILDDGNIVVTITEVRPGTKYKECCISEVKFYGVN